MSTASMMSETVANVGVTQLFPEIQRFFFVFVFVFLFFNFKIACVLLNFMRFFNF